GQFRYLFPDIAGEADVEVLPDRITSTTRYAMTFKHNEAFSSVPGLGAFVNLQKVSDNTYFADLSDRLAITSQTNLPRDGGFAYSKGPFAVLAHIQTFQTLQDPNNPITPPYFREPQILFTLNPVEWAGLDFAGNGEYVRFRQPALINADRTVLYPTVGWTKRGNAWFVTARTGLHMSTYNLENLRFEIGQRFYFADQRVTLSETPRSANTSDLIFAAEGRLTDTFSAAGTYEVSVNHRHTQELDLGVRWQPSSGKVLNASYRYN